VEFFQDFPLEPVEVIGEVAVDKDEEDVVLSVQNNECEELTSLKKQA